MPSRLTTTFAGIAIAIMASCPVGAAAASTAPVPTPTAAGFTPLPGPPPPPTPLFDTITRISGQGRVDTSLKAAAAFYPGRPSAMVVASAHDYADAIGGARLASSLHAPLLLLDEDNFPGIYPYAIPHLYDDSDGRKSVYLLGGTAAISQSAEDRFRASSGGTYDVVRIAGANRYDTAARVAAATPDSPGPIYVVNGQNFPDGLTVAALAAQTKGVVLFSEGDKPSPDTENYLNQIDPTRSRVIAVGGASAKAVPSAPSVVGADRYDTAALLAEHYSSQAPVSVIGIATGENWPDALVAASTMGQLGGPLLLADRDAVQPATLLPSLVAAQPGLHSAVIFGGQSAVSPAVEQQLVALGNKATP